MNSKLDRKFYNRDTIEVAKDLLGKLLVYQVDNKKLIGKIVETEAYMGPIDKAAHSYGGKRTPRVEVMYGKPGVAYIYLIYGMYNCFNVVTREEGRPEAVLVRALEPVEGLDEMALNRFKKPYNELNKKQIKNLTNGPGKLCMAFNIDRSLNKEDLCENKIFIKKQEFEEKFDIIHSKRIGIDYAEEAKDYLWRFYIKGNEYVSVK
ncbi:putative 3-methyladenine DNA glycosylase [Gottschalkia purinilytica]|uniref:Putative 3-methyladenine DNA glycosylase n=1 Tax=Gottschalkia purinilytica TaxID=1503 RepID=A0A0L0WEY0_GOTPU|nr:DNA-3-methyladenine glycosylase [Gottschalkia purinilytica]KNF09986.1 putative 3-methyladenine DNA glycosylase [Gottschalkia purinilytica]